MKINCSQKIVTVKAVLQTWNEKLKYIKIGTTFYCN